mgnify:CR=1 FL=1
MPTIPQRSCLPIYVIAIIGLLSFLSLDDLEGTVNNYVAVESGSTVFHYCRLVPQYPTTAA